jgi:hypothetical protein
VDTSDFDSWDRRHHRGAGIALLFLISSFFAKIPGGVKWALIVLGLTVLQVGLGLLSLFVAGLGWLHSLNALALFGAALKAGTRVPRAVAAGTAAEEEPEVEPALTQPARA